jgi:hypothetical protein
MTEPDHDEHARLRKHVNAFFTPANVERVYATLRDAALRTVQELGQAQQSASGLSVMHGRSETVTRSAHTQIDAAGEGGEGVAVNGWDLAHDLINQVVMKVRLFARSQRRRKHCQHLPAQQGMTSPPAAAQGGRCLQPRRRRAWHMPAPTFATCSSWSAAAGDSCHRRRGMRRRAAVPQVFFESEQQIDMDTLMDAFTHAGLLSANPWYLMLLQYGFEVQPRRARRNYAMLCASRSGADARASSSPS